jgi:3-hydroxyacyl-CoA dehydrogenase/enoyl-CoA hydratase/3-hydroxybutyryl-CoA epimerase
MSAFTFNVDDKGVATLLFDLPNEKVNKLSTEVMVELRELLSSFNDRQDIKVLLIRSAKPGIFIAGADIKEIEDITDPQEGFEKASMGQGIMNQLAFLEFPTIAVIEGVALGGGLELALACSFRVASDSSKVQLGLPEVNLGIIPGFGGTQRLPRLIGVQQALPMILAGKSVDTKAASKVGLIDASFSEVFFEDGLSGFVDDVVSGKRPVSYGIRRQFKGMIDQFLDTSFIGRALVFRQAKKNLMAQTKGQYPAPLAALDAVKYGVFVPITPGLKMEAHLFSKLVITPICKNLIRLFYIQEALKKDIGVRDSVAIKPMTHFGVLGAGLMGGGIAWLFSYRGGIVRIKDVTWPAIAKALKTASELYQGLVKKRKLTESGMTMAMHHLSGGLDFTGFSQANVVVEAIVEDMAIKKKVFEELEANISEETIIASNTSGLSITEMASVLKKPERFVGMHFFSPVHRMPLVEVIRGEKTSDETVAHIVQLSKDLKKTPIVVENCPGFLVNRILIPYVNEAVRLLEDGVSLATIDKVAVDFGMPLGPLALADEVGLDVGYKVAKQLQEGYGDRMAVAKSFEAIHQLKDVLGKKSGKGFYIHGTKEKFPNLDLKIEQSGCVGVSEAEVRDRLFLIMVNEAARCLAEGIVKKVSYLDMAMILGTGFPPFRGGLMRYADSLGIDGVKGKLNALKEKYGSRFEPAPLINELAASKLTFGQWEIGG